jgi:hypothetical protein
MFAELRNQVAELANATAGVPVWLATTMQKVLANFDCAMTDKCRTSAEGRTLLHCRALSVPYSVLEVANFLPSLSIALFVMGLPRNSRFQDTQLVL